MNSRGLTQIRLQQVIASGVRSAPRAPVTHSTTPPTEQTTSSRSLESSSAKSISELARLRLQNLLLMRQLCEEQLSTLTLRFAQTPEPRALQMRIDELNAVIQNSTSRLFEEENLNPHEYQLDVNSGAFVRRSPQQS